MRMTMSAAAAALFLTTVTADAQAPGSPDKGITLPGARNSKVTQVYQHAVPGIPGKSVKGVMVEYGPGGFSPSHTHAKSALIYATVIEGSVRSQVNDGPVVTYRAGQNWTEMPGDHHRVSANASKTRAAKILAVFVVDDVDAELTIPDKEVMGLPELAYSTLTQCRRQGLAACLGHKRACQSAPLKAGRSVPSAAPHG